MSMRKVTIIDRAKHEVCNHGHGTWYCFFAFFVLLKSKLFIKSKKACTKMTLLDGGATGLCRWLGLNILKFVYGEETIKTKFHPLV